MSKFRKLISALLAAVMLFGCASAMASATYPDKLTTYWDAEYYYKGELTLGESTVFCDEDSFYNYYVFNASDEGYYTIGYNDDGGVYEIVTLEKSSIIGGNYYDESYGVTGNQEGLSLFYLYEGVNYIGVCFGAIMPKGDKINIDYMGAEITDINFDAGTEYPLILREDMDEYGSMRVRDYTLTFDTEKTLELVNATDRWFDYYCDKEITVGENEIEIEFGEKTFSRTVTVAEITDYIKKVELASGGIEEIVYYDGSLYGSSDITLKVTYTDGTSENVYAFEDVSLRNGNPYLYYIYLDTYDGHASVEIAEHEYLSFEYEIKQAGFGENFELFISNIGDEFRYITSIPYYAEDIFNQDSVADSLRAFGEFVSFVNNQFMYAIGDIFEHITMFVQTLF